MGARARLARGDEPAVHPAAASITASTTSLHRLVARRTEVLGRGLLCVVLVGKRSVTIFTGRGKPAFSVAKLVRSQWLAKSILDSLRGALTDLIAGANGVAIVARLLPKEDCMHPAFGFVTVVCAVVLPLLYLVGLQARRLGAWSVRRVPPRDRVGFFLLLNCAIGLFLGCLLQPLWNIGAGCTEAGDPLVHCVISQVAAAR